MCLSQDSQCEHKTKEIDDILAADESSRHCHPWQHCGERERRKEANLWWNHLLGRAKGHAVGWALHRVVTQRSPVDGQDAWQYKGKSLIDFMGLKSFLKKISLISCNVRLHFNKENACLVTSLFVFRMDRSSLLLDKIVLISCDVTLGIHLRWYCLVSITVERKLLTQRDRFYR